MTVFASKLTQKYQATIPADVRRKLGLKAGDSVAFDVDGDEIRLRKAQTVDLVFADAVSRTLNEWSSSEDEEAYRDL